MIYQKENKYSRTHKCVKNVHAIRQYSGPLGICERQTIRIDGGKTFILQNWIFSVMTRHSQFSPSS